MRGETGAMRSFRELAGSGTVRKQLVDVSVAQRLLGEAVGTRSLQLFCRLAEQGHGG